MDRISEYLWENASKNKTWVLLPQFVQNTELFLEYKVFVFFPGVVDRSVFTSDYAWLLAVAIQLNVYSLYVSMDMCLPCMACPYDYI